jgi:predicted metal-binding transcription factor (methanogenesis marker protein 9)
VYDPVSGTFGSSTAAGSRNAVYAKYGIDVTKLPGYTPFDQYKKPETKKQTIGEVLTDSVEQPITQPTAPTSTQQYFTPEQQQRFAEIINAQYQGPASLQQAGLYEQAAQSARSAQQAAQLTQTALGRGQLLKDIFGRNRDYKGKLDALLLNTSQQGVSDLQKQAEGAAKAQEVLQAEQNLSATRAAQRAAAIEQVRSGARTAFTEGRGAEEQAVEDRIDSLIKTPAKDESGNPIPKMDAEGKPILDADGKPVYQTEWDRLPEYFREAIRKAPELNRATQEEGLKELERSSGLSIKRFDELPGQISSIQSRLQQLQRDIPQGSRIPGSASAAEQTRMRNQINELTKQLQGLQTEYSSYSDFGTQLKNLRDMNMNQVQLSPEEMAVLGVKSGEGLYNLGQGLIENVEARRERLITKDELSRQLALQQLAGLDLSKELQKDLLYTDLEKAGTQDLSSSLNTERIRELLNKEREDFRDRAEEDVLVGSGTKKVTRGNWSGTRKKTYYAEQSGKVADMLREAGYDVSAQDEEAIGSMLSDKQALENFLGATSTSRGDSGSMYAEGGARTAAGAATGAGIGAYFAAPWLGAGIGAAAGSLIGDNSTLSNFVGDLGGGRMSASSMARVGRGTAKELAIKDLQNKYKNYLEQAGFSNRLAASQDPQVLARMEGLKNLLGRKG